MIVQMNFDRISVTIVIFSVFSPQKETTAVVDSVDSEKKAFLDYL